MGLEKKKGKIKAIIAVGKTKFNTEHYKIPEIQQLGK